MCHKATNLDIYLAALNYYVELPNRDWVLRFGTQVNSCCEPGEEETFEEDDTYDFDYQSQINVKRSLPAEEQPEDSRIMRAELGGGVPEAKAEDTAELDYKTHIMTTYSKNM